VRLTAQIALYLLAVRGLMCVLGIQPLWFYVRRWRAGR
jgi:hypothetical protein